MAPRITVVIPCFNAGRFIADTITSAIHQTYPPDEVIVVDDGSTDESYHIAAAFGGRVRVIRQDNAGESGARNRGLDEAKGDWVALLDADDVWRPAKLARQVQALRMSTDLVCVHTGYYLFGATERVPELPTAVGIGRYEIEALLITPLVNTSTALVRADLPLRFPEWTRDAEDMLYFVEMTEFGSFAYVDEPLTGYRMHDGQQTKSPTSVVRNLQSRLMWLERNTQRLGHARHSRLSALLHDEVIHRLRIAKWTRNWKRYWALREFASQLQWPNGAPAELVEPILPAPVYWLKDALTPRRRGQH
jgi:glycosyltransferase involved in cell wall biosynthesis